MLVLPGVEVILFIVVSTGLCFDLVNPDTCQESIQNFCARKLENYCVCMSHWIKSLGGRVISFFPKIIARNLCILFHHSKNFLN